MSETVYLLNNKYFDIKIKKRGISSFKNKQIETDVEFMETDCLFGHIHLTYKLGDSDWKILKTEHIQSFVSTNSTTQYKVLYRLEQFIIEINFTLEGKYLNYSITVENEGEDQIEIGDLSIPFPMNSLFNWGDDANKKVLRHSFISGHGSYIFWERCNGMAPYLLMTPKGETKFEYNQMFKNELKENRNTYEAFIYSKVEGGFATGKGCNWRQSHTSITLESNEKINHELKFQWRDNYDEIRQAIVEEGLLDIQVIPGMTVPNDLFAMFSIHSDVKIREIKAEYEQETKIEFIKLENKKAIYKVKFEKLGENFLHILFDEDKEMRLEFFSTEPVETLINKRAKFIANHQVRDSSVWYDGLLAEWNMESKTLLTPDNYDRIKGWRIYEVTCDDPGLSKPAFLSTKLVEFPNQEEVEALDYYIENFVWGGLQRTDDEEFSYGIYGIPDWKVNRESESMGQDGRLHIWRIYDYPHIALMYWNMYLVANSYPDINTYLNASEYLNRAYQTAIAMFTLPWELEEWSAYNTGLYNELVIPIIIDELYRVDLNEKAKRLELLWTKKVKHFVLEKPDVFGSEYPFDTTGFESTYAFAAYAQSKIKHSIEDVKREEKEFHLDKVNKFMELQRKCNIACRGWLEPAYYLLGSDYRTENTAYTLSYMAQMGTNGILTYALQHLKDEETDNLLQLGYASLLSSWALMNTGTKESDYGYWYKGIENDGSAGGGFEPAPYGETWLNQKHHRGSWYYSCEIDLGFCGAVRASTVVINQDQIFGDFCYGGDLTQTEQSFSVILKDGIRRRVSVVGSDSLLNIEVKGTRVSNKSPMVISKNHCELSCELEMVGGNLIGQILVTGLENGDYKIKINGHIQQVEVRGKKLITNIHLSKEGKNQLRLYKFVI